MCFKIFRLVNLYLKAFYMLYEYINLGVYINISSQDSFNGKQSKFIAVYPIIFCL